MQSGLADSQDIYIYVSMTHEVVKEAVCSLGWQTLKIYICKHESQGS